MGSALFFDLSSETFQELLQDFLAPELEDFEHR